MIADWIDARRLAPAYARSGRIHIPDFLAADAAAGLFQALNGDLPWSRTLLLGGQGYEAPVADLAAIPETARQDLSSVVGEAARAGFQYDYETWRLSDRMEAGLRTGGAAAPLEAFYDVLNGPAFLGLIRDLTGNHEAAFCDAQATRYRAGHFLNAHTDDVAGKHRLFAYVLNLTPNWRADWGGLLLFQDGDGHIAEGYTPRFNALNLFTVPQSHSVSQVANFVTASRLSITGWVRARG